MEIKRNNKWREMGKRVGEEKSKKIKEEEKNKGRGE